VKEQKGNRGGNKTGVFIFIFIFYFFFIFYFDRYIFRKTLGSFSPEGSESLSRWWGSVIGLVPTLS